MVITLVRNGQTDADFNQIIQGRMRVLLNDTGRRQCQKLKFSILNNKYDYCYMSPAISSVETAMILIGDRVETIPDDRLLEREMGDLEGKPREEYNAYSFWDYDLNRGDYGIEKIQDVFKRCQEFLDYIFTKHSDKNIMIVTHETPYMALRHLLMRHELMGKMLDGGVNNCSIEVFEYKKKYRVLVF